MMPVYAIIDDTDPGLVYTGDWRVLTDPINPRAPDYNGTIHVTNDPSATVSYQFYGSMLSAFGTIDTPASNGYPNASFSISSSNGGSSPDLHLNETGYMPHLEEPNVATTHLKLFTSDRLELGTYTMSIKTDGVSAGGAPFYLDFLTVLVPDDVASQVGWAIVDDSDMSRWSYVADQWTITHKGTTYLVSAHQTHEEGSFASLVFQGTHVEVYGSLIGVYTDTLSLGSFSVDGGDPHAVYVSSLPGFNAINNGRAAMRHQRIFALDGLYPETHNLTVSVPSTPNGYPPWFLDYAIYGYASPDFTQTPSTGPSSSPGAGPPVLVGAVVGGVVGGVILLAAAFFGCLIWRRRREAHGDMDLGVEIYTDGPPITRALSRRMRSMHKRRERQGPPETVVGSGLDESSVGESSERVAGPRTEKRDGASKGEAVVHAVRDENGQIREVDGGVRLTVSSRVPIEEVLPPSYARYR
ncbi:hypothetical protein M408DRAFT_29556 [Serendipita vermifera MAFF 305830]|uniref:Uncharacterized protein n=1 Tax=Serendipita vermifera MAFF 305830 TaxID=933852 RepID=A0A0C3AQ80_SERVB|nr:hypothetical protein M408DRAFT_29556 [Serendipita vermifera MAFF 305830]